MSRANSNNVLPALARRNHTHHDHYNTPQFCDLLESAVEYMQTKHLENPRGHPFSELPDDFLEQLRDAIHAGRYYMLALGVVLIYEFIITIDLEVELVWRRLRRCIVIFLFFLNRYLALATYIFVISGVQYANTDSGFCTGIFSRFPSVFIVLAEAMTGTVRLIKIGTLWKDDPKGKIFGGVICVVFLVQLSTAIACASALQGIGPLFGKHLTQFGCFLVFQKGSMPRLIVHWFSSMVFNILVCYSVMKKLLAMPLFKNTDNRELSDVLLRDVKVMLIAIVFLHIANLLMLVFFPYWNAINWAFSSIADIILTSRLLFNLREVLVSKACQCAGDDEPQLPLYKDLPPPPVYSSTSVKKPFTDSSFTSLKQSSA